jgi:hypothetical protein
MKANTKRIVNQLNIKSTKSTNLFIKRIPMQTRQQTFSKKLDNDSMSSMDDDDNDIDDVSLQSEAKHNQADTNQQNVNKSVRGNSNSYGRGTTSIKYNNNQSIPKSTRKRQHNEKYQ